MAKIKVYSTANEIRKNSEELMDKMKRLKKEVNDHVVLVNNLHKELEQQAMQPKSEKTISKKDDKRFNNENKSNKTSKQNNGKIEVNESLSSKATAKKAVKNNNTKKKRNINAWEAREEGQGLNKIKTNKSKKKNSRTEQPKKIEKIPERKKAITIGEITTVKELSETAGISVADIIKQLMNLGILATINQEIDFDMASLVASQFNITLEKKVTKTHEDELIDQINESEEKGQLVERAAVVTVMGHVDHGKTSLLDAIRKTSVTKQEAGGITQHIGAYTVSIKDKFITFLDTPGHAAFTSMRARGAQVTDIAILVVAADDGVMPQTIEAINHAKAANVPIIVAINKIDSPNANPERIKQQLSEHGLLVEEWGGDVIAVPVSALKKQGIDNLLEMVLLVAEMQELKANPKTLARGTIIEAQLDKGRGPVATVLVQNGTLNIGDSIVAGTASGRVRAMIDDKGRRVKKAGPSLPVEVLGLSDVPEAGDILYAVQDEKLAKQVADERKEKLKEDQIKSSAITSLDDLFTQIKEGEIKELNIIIKADVQGSCEAVRQALERLSNDEVKIKTIHQGVGAVTESDVMLARASNAIVIGFNVRPSNAAIDLAEQEKVDVRSYRVIYDAIQDIEKAMNGLLDPEYKEVILGHAEIRATFKVSGVGTIAGCYVRDGKITRNSKVRVLRDGVVIHEGELASLKRFKDDAKEVSSGYECGMGIQNFNDIKEGDIIEAFINQEIRKE
ncbi:translation initiation factor IF-2 [Xylanivirga thermophila]|uniref:translation initiation factor IF-2 n=1 Tax=Xylanivirga thermophila TaxID=2496273 RepID=UPI00101DF9E3|nr:translation initiation factor IF-2 [Xylanivirga thermophila]